MSLHIGNYRYSFVLYKGWIQIDMALPAKKRMSRLQLDRLLLIVNNIQLYVLGKNLFWGFWKLILFQSKYSFPSYSKICLPIDHKQEDVKKCETKASVKYKE